MPPEVQFAENRRRWADAVSGTTGEGSFQSSHHAHSQAPNAPQHGSAAPSPSASLIILSPQGAAKLMEVAEDLINPLLLQTPLPYDTRAQLFALIREEIATGTVTIPPTDRANTWLRMVLMQSFSTSSRAPLPALERESFARSIVGMQLSIYVLLKTPTSGLSPQLQAFRAEMVSQMSRGWS